MTHSVYYMSQSIILDDILSIASLAGTLIILMFVELLPMVSILFFCFACLCCYFVVDVTRKHRVRFQITDEGLAVEHVNCYLSWDQLEEFKLAYYSTRKDAEHGWMEVYFKIGKRRVRVDSRAVGFMPLARYAAAAATRLDLPLSPATVKNIHLITA